MNNILQIYQAMKNGNPASVFQQMLGNNPQAKQIIQMMNSGQSVTNIVDSELKKAGMTREQAIQELKKQGLL